MPTFSLSVTEPSELVEEVGTTRRIGRADIDARHTRTLDEALRLIPGVYVRTGGDGTPRVDIRGLRSRHVLLLVNGVPMNSTADGQFDPARIPMTAIREIKVSSLEWTWQAVPGSSFRGAAQYGGPQLYDSRGSDPMQLRTDAYARVDLGVTQAITRRYEVAFDVTNVFD